MKIRAILVASLVALGSSSAPAEPLLRSGFGGAAPPRPPELVGRADHPSQPRAPMPRSRPAAIPANKPEPKSAATPVPANVVMIGPSATARASDHPMLTGSPPDAPTFPPAP